jgi:hypothetical protein
MDRSLAFLAVRDVRGLREHLRTAQRTVVVDEVRIAAPKVSVRFIDWVVEPTLVWHGKTARRGQRNAVCATELST